MSIETPAAPQTEIAAAEQDQTAEQVFTEESLVEEVSIDGMCGVY